jgi:predicted metal-dependent HD superfamily phosphohydrolase
MWFRGTVPRCFNALVDLPDSWPLSAADDVRDALLTAYADPSRSYHDTRHLTEVVARLAEIGAAGVAYERVPVLLAAWFHDAVYDGERDAEERSAVWAEEALAPLLDPAAVAEVARLVRLTETHRPEDDDVNGCALSDADLAILAAPPERYREYVAAVRREYAHVDEESFRRGRAGVLRALLDKRHLFHTDFARDAWERAARDNAEAELAGLEA